MNALLQPEDQASGASVRRWENDEGRPSVVQGWALAQLDPEQRGTDWLAVADAETPATERQGGGTYDRPEPIAKEGPGTPAKKPTKRLRHG